MVINGAFNLRNSFNTKANTQSCGVGEVSIERNNFAHTFKCQLVVVQGLRPIKYTHTNLLVLQELSFELLK